jgi:cAMP-dependent protein kinase regulator
LESAKVSEDWKSPVFEKTSEQAAMLTKRVQDIFFMQTLGPKDVETVVKAFELKKFQVGDILMKQGEEGDSFYVLEEGITDVMIDGIGESEASKKVAEKNGNGEQNFVGELALLYNAPRSATIVAQTAVTSWALDRTTFKTIITESAKGQTEAKIGFLAKVPLLDPLSEGEKLQLADALKSKRYEKGALVIKEGTLKGDEMFIIEEGTVVCTKNQGGMEVNVSPELGSGKFFGELALLNDQPRAASVKALSAVSALAIDRATFKRVLGPLQDILKEAQKNY